MQGVDIFSQLVYGGQVAFEVGLSVTVIGIAIGGTLGVIAAYFGGWVDAVISRVLDILIAFPALVLALVIAEGLGPSELHVIWALCGVRHPGGRPGRARRHADDPGAAVHDRRAAVRHPRLADHRPPRRAEHHARAS